MPPVLLLALAALFWAGNYLVGEQVVRRLDPLSMTWLRWAPAVVPLLVLAHLVERPDWRALLRRWRTLLAVGLVGLGAYPFLLYLALRHTSAVNASIVNAVNPAAIVVAAVLLGQARVARRGWLGVGLGLVGVLLVLTEGDLDRLLGLRLNPGDLLMLGAVAAWTVYTLAGRRLTLPPLAATAAQAALVTLALAPVVAVSGLQLPSESSTWWGLLYIVVFPSIGAYLCWNWAVPRVSPGTAATSMNLVTVFTVLISAVLGRPPTLVQLLGGVLVIGGMLLATPRAARTGPAPGGGAP
ncbi:DMT family transporter [Ornithinimicrobium humiphilum]|uniref:Drug/metabolite transporter (DMT)-like permease n=1 Tax=Ornithinimicrobium humiphilum TaxID=125288 RepID=A0A543K6J4_9MICO|nr:DMT family transporter [Ornithinimicrobium humiphilum]TQM90682.1 drug/metabolite transporter (DMT)-like permease [Ornithinimicrobium humiphilum]